MLTAGTQDIAYTVTAASLLTGISDLNGEGLSIANLVASNGNWIECGQCA